MAADEFKVWKIESQANYAKEKEKAGLSKEEAEAVAEKSFRELLPSEEKSEGQFLFSIIESSSGKVVGTLWWGLQKQSKDPLPWIYDIMLSEASRGKGYGRAAMEAAQASVKENGYSRLGLHVFGHNQVARKLYESMNFKPISIVMQKEL